jgi:glycosyltransferase involved in cell wall biosynthesis
MPPRVTIITRTFDRPRLLGRTLDSLAAQSFRDWECVIVNGGSEAGAKTALEPRSAALAGRVRVLPFDNSKPGMRGIPLNYGLAHSESELVTVLDDDDTWESGFLETMIGALDRVPSPATVGGIVCRSKCIDESSVEEGLLPQREYPLNGDLENVTLARLAIVNAWCIHAFIYRRAALAKTGLYAEDLPVLEDWEFNLRFALHWDIAVLPQMLTNYHLRPSVKSGAESNTQHSELDRHKFYESKIINDALRRDLEAGRTGLGMLLANAAQSRWLERKVHAVESKLRSAADKIGKIDARTKAMKDARS